MYGSNSQAGLTMPTVAAGTNDLIKYTGPLPIPSVGALKSPPPPQLSLLGSVRGGALPGPALAPHGAAIPTSSLGQGGW